MFYLIFNNKDNRNFGIEVKQRPTIPAPEKKTDTIEIPGYDGKYYIDYDTYEDIKIPVEFTLVEEDLDNIKSRYREILSWLNNINDNKLIFSDDIDWTYIVKSVEIDDLDYDEFYEFKTFKVNFVCEAYQYQLRGLKERKVIDIINNSYMKCKPVYRLETTLTTTYTIKINNISVKCKGNIIIDTMHDKILNSSDKTLAVGVTNINNMQDLYLNHGKNIISIPSNVSLFITPNFRSV